VNVNPIKRLNFGTEKEGKERGDFVNE